MRRYSLFVSMMCLFALSSCAVLDHLPSLSSAGALSSPDEKEKVKISNKVEGIVADFFGVPATSISPDTDIIQDLHADYMDLFDLTIRICGEYKIDCKKNKGASTVKDLSDFVFQQRRASQGIRFRSMPSKKKYYLKTVFFGTDRERTGSEDVDEYFGKKRSRDSQISYGVCKVSIPLTHKSGELESPSWFKLEFFPDPKKHIVLMEIKDLGHEKFFSEMQKQLNNPQDDGPTSQDAVVFIHGFNTSFSEAARRTAQLSFDLGFTGVPILYSWPSNNSLLGYIYDRENVEWSSAHIKNFLLDVATKVKAKRLHLIAHSMGNQGLIRALTLLANETGDKPLFDNVIFAAPDYDARTFAEQIAPKILKLSRKWTLYVSDKDQALNASAFLASSRLGQPLTVINGIDTIDASGIDVSPWSVPEFHSYYASKKTVIHDLISLIKGMNPARRSLASEATKSALSYWKLKISGKKK